MKKTFLLLLAFLPFLGFGQVVDLAAWALTTDGQGTTPQTFVQVNNFTGPPNPSDVPITYSTDGALSTTWDAGYLHYKYLEISISATAGNIVFISNLLFEQERKANGPTNYTAKYYVLNNASTLPGTFDFFNIARTLIADETIDGNPTKNVPVSQSVSADQTLIIRFYAKGGTNTDPAGWLIKANTLKLTGSKLNALSGTYTIGDVNTCDFGSITAAVNTLNNIGVDGNVLFLLDNVANVSTYKSSSVEVFPITINPYTGNTDYTVTFKPFTGKTVTIEATNNATTVFKLNGVDNVIIDGSNVIDGTSKDLTIYNNNTTNLKKSVIWIASQNATNGASNNQIKNVTLQQYYRDDDLSIGVFAGGTSAISSVAEAANSNNTVRNTTFTKVGQAVFIYGNSSSLSSNWKIQNNIIGGTLDSNKPFAGVILVNAKDYEVSGNSIQGLVVNANNNAGEFYSAIIVLNASNGSIFNNKIIDISNNYFYLYFTGIYIDSSVGNNLIYNNLISKVYGTNDSHGIYINSGSGSKVYYNTILMNGETSTNGASCLKIVAGTNIEVKNNLFVNTQTTGTQYAISSATSLSAISGISNNDYFVLNATDKFSNRINNTDYIGLGATGFPKWNSDVSDVNSKIILPDFETDFQLQDTPNNQNLVAIEAPSITTTDLLGKIRLRPYMGAFELNGCLPEGDQVSYGSNSWIGYVYTWQGTPAPSTYVGNVTEANAVFDRNLGTNPISGSTTELCLAPTTTYFVRYKMNLNITEVGQYIFTVGGNDGYRLYIDGGTTPIIDNWLDGNYTSKTALYQITTAGDHKFVLEFYQNTGEARVSFSYGLVNGNSTLTYGDNAWNVYGFNTNDFNSVVDNSPYYAGYYLDANLNINTTNFWPIDQSPSAATNWNGIPVPNDNFTVSLRRKGFPCGNYQIELANRDEAVQLYIDGSLIETFASASNSSVLFGGGTTYPLTKDSEVEIRLREDTGDAFVAVNFIDSPVSYVTGATVPANTSIVVAQNANVTTDLTVCSCYINSGITLTVDPDKTLTVIEKIEVTGSGKLVVDNNGSLLQDVNGTFNGGEDSFIMKRTSAEMKNFDYTYWSSPVVGQTALELSPNTLSDKYYKWANGWVFYNGEMMPGFGYIIRVPKPGSPAPDNWSGATYFQPVSFIGNPNNGEIICESVIDSENYLIGNPYPSAINADNFIEINKDIIEGALYFWTHYTAIKPNGNGQYVYTADDYAVYNSTGSISGAPSGTGTGNFVDSNNNGVLDPGEEITANQPTGYIAAGQSFFAKGKGFGTITFNNTMRVGGNNSQFFKMNQAKIAIEKSRLWLNLTNDGGAFKQILIGYVPEATNEYESKYDAKNLNGNTFINFYSLINGVKFAIQGRALPFSNSDSVPLGYSSTVGGDFKINIAQTDGGLLTQPVYLEDKLNGTTSDLRKSAYAFTTAKGTYNNRFLLKFTNSALGTDAAEILPKVLIVSVKNKIIAINAHSEDLAKVLIYDLTGKLIYSNSKINAPFLEISNLKMANQVLLVKVALKNGVTETKKVLFN